jgi:tetratricopeptide (TPR) repeat protein
VLVTSSVAPLVIFYVLGRFRAPLLAALLPFAALATVELVRYATRRRFLPLAAALVAVLALAGWSGRPLTERPMIRLADWLVPYGVRYDPEIRAALAAGDPARASAACLEFLQQIPASAAGSQADRGAFASMHVDCASMLREGGQPSQAKVQLRVALTLDPSNVDALGLLADVLFSERAFAEASVHYQAFVQARPQDLGALARLGESLFSTGRPDEALVVLRRAVEVNPRHAGAQRNLANALLQQQDVEGAARHAEQAVALRPGDPVAHDLLGVARAMQGKRDAARAEFEKALQLDPGYAAAREHLRRLQRQPR